MKRMKASPFEDPHENLTTCYVMTDISKTSQNSKFISKDLLEAKQLRPKEGLLTSCIIYEVIH